MKPTPQWAVPMEPVSEDQIIKTCAADVVILGAGHAGTAAARAAAEAGAGVLVVEQQQEKRFEVYGAQYGSVNSEFMTKRGAPQVDPVRIIADWQRRSLNRANPALVRQFAYNTGSTFDWFVDPLPEEMKDVMTFENPWPKHFEGELNGYDSYVGTAIFKNSKFDPSMMPPLPEERPDGNGEAPDPSAPKPKMPMGAPQSLTEAVVFTHELTKKLGAEFVFGITGDYLEKDETGRVIALIGHNYKKEYFRFVGKHGIILAAGDFSGNKAMVMDLLGEYAALTEEGEKYPYIPAGRKGKGVQMGLWAGGKMEPGPRGGMWCCVGGSGGPMDGSAFLRLNKHGKRYTNEGIMGYWGAGLQGARQPKGALYTIWDSNWREELEYQTLDHSSVDMADQRALERIAMQMEKARRLGIDNSYPAHGPPSANRGLHNTLVSDDTIEGLADKLGLTGQDRANFIASVARYNELAHKGRDEDFAKDPRQLHPIEQPPYYAYCENVRAVGFLMVTVCGLVVDENQQVLNRDDEPIPGLYATGNCSGERFPILYTTPVAGVSIGIAYTLGRIVGDYVAKHP